MNKTAKLKKVLLIVNICSFFYNLMVYFKPAKEKQKMKRILAAAMALGLAQTAVAVDWVFLNVGNSPEVLLYGEADSRTANQAWFEFRYSKPQRLPTNNKRFYKTRKSLYEVLCSSQQYRLLSSVDYGQSGNVMYSWQAPRYSNNWEYVIPETFGESVYNFICKQEPR